MYPSSRMGQVAYFSLGLVFATLLALDSDEVWWARVAGGGLSVLMGASIVKALLSSSPRDGDSRDARDA